MIFNFFKLKATYACIFLSVFFLTGCPSEEESELIRQNIEAHQLNIDNIAITPSTDLVLRVQDPLQFQVKGLLGDIPVMTGPDSSTPVDLASQVTWSVEPETLGKISSNGLFTSLDQPGSVTITATFSNMENSVLLVITDSPIDSITITPETSTVDVCRNLLFAARATLADGNQIPLTNDDLIWSISETQAAIAGFKDNTTGVLSTYLVSEGLNVSAKSSSDESINTSVQIEILDTLVDAVLTSENNTISLKPEQSLSFTLTGEYSDGSVEDISANSTFRSENIDIADFVEQVLTVKVDASEGPLNVFGKCNREEDSLEIAVLKPTL